MHAAGQIFFINRGDGIIRRKKSGVGGQDQHLQAHLKVTDPNKISFFTCMQYQLPVLAGQYYDDVETVF